MATPAARQNTSSCIQCCDSHISGDSPPPARLNSFSTQLASAFSQPSITLTSALEYPDCVIQILQNYSAADASASTTLTSLTSGVNVTLG